MLVSELDPESEEEAETPELTSPSEADSISPDVVGTPEEARPPSLE